MTPRMAYWLWNSSIYLADTWRCGRDDPGPLLDLLPPIAWPFAKGDWIGRFTDCFEQLATRIAAGDGDQERLATEVVPSLVQHHCPTVGPGRGAQTPVARLVSGGVTSRAWWRPRSPRTRLAGRPPCTPATAATPVSSGNSAARSTAP